MTTHHPPAEADCHAGQLHPAHMAGVEAACSLWQGQAAPPVRQGQEIGLEYEVELLTKAMEHILRLGGETC